MKVSCSLLMKGVTIMAEERQEQDEEVKVHIVIEDDEARKEYYADKRKGAMKGICVVVACVAIGFIIGRSTS